MMNGQSLKGSVALITGGGSGIGRATALVLGKQGAKIVITELPSRTIQAEKVVAELKAQGVEASCIGLDVRSAMTIPYVIEYVVRTFGSLDILINNAGIQLLKPALEIEEHEFDEVMNVNLKGAFLCCQAAGQVMSEQRNGVIVNVASQHGVVGNINRAPYCASKAGLINLTRALAIEWAEYGIRVNAISPTFVVNESNRETLESPALMEQIARGVPTGRAATSEEIAWGINYLVSPMAAMVTGHNLVVDGGWTAR